MAGNEKAADEGPDPEAGGDVEPEIDGLPDLDVTDEAGEVVKGGVPKIPD